MKRESCIEAVAAAKICNEDKWQKCEWFASKITPYFFSCGMILIFTKIEIATSASRPFSANILVWWCIFMNINRIQWMDIERRVGRRSFYLTHVDSRRTNIASNIRGTPALQ